MAVMMRRFQQECQPLTGSFESRQHGLIWRARMDDPMSRVSLFLSDHAGYMLSKRHQIFTQSQMWKPM